MVCRRPLRHGDVGRADVDTDGIVCPWQMQPYFSESTLDVYRKWPNGMASCGVSMDCTWTGCPSDLRRHERACLSKGLPTYIELFYGAAIVESYPPLPWWYRSICTE